MSTWDSECGIATYTKDLTDALRTLGHNVTILAEIRDPADAQVRAEPAGYAVHRCWSRKSGYHAPYGLKHVWEAVKSSPKKPAVVHFQHEFGLFPDNAAFKLAVAALLGAGITAVTTLHTVLLDSQLTFDPSPSRIIVHTPTAAAAWGGRSASVVIPHGVKTKRNAKWSNDSPRLVLCPGFMGPNKGQREAIDIYAKSHLWSRGIKLALVGKCPDGYYSELQSRIAGYGLQDYVILDAGFKPEVVMDQYFGRADVVLLSGGKTSPYSASGQLHTALAWGKAVLAKNNPIYRSTGGGVLLWDSVEEAARLLAGLQTETRLLLERESELAADERRWSTVAATHVAWYERW